MTIQKQHCSNCFVTGWNVTNPCNALYCECHGGQPKKLNPPEPMNNDVTPSPQNKPQSPTNGEEKMREENCPFCKMSFPDTEVLNIEPLNPVTKGHRIFIPKEHVQDFAENEHVTIKTMYSAQQYAKKVGGEFNIITSAGKSATQSVFHLHVHFVPRTENDGLHLPWTGQIKKDSHV